MDSKVWGPHFWFILHLVSFNYPDNPSTPDKDNYKRFYDSIGDILPCQLCKQHYKNYISQFPISVHLDSRIDLITWVVQVHNFVNQSLNKPIYTVQNALDIYANLDPVSPFINTNINVIKRQKINKYYGKLYVMIFICLILLALVIYYHHKYYYYCL
jgi:hypothetical protein